MSLTTKDAETLAEATDQVAAEHQHWAAFDNTGHGDFVCHCGLPWVAGEGCPFVQGARALAAALASGAVRREAEVRSEAWDEGYASGFSNAMRRMSDEPDAPTTPNPYRAALAEEGDR